MRKHLAHLDALSIEKHARTIDRAPQELCKVSGGLFGIKNDQRETLTRGNCHPVARDKAGPSRHSRDDRFESGLGGGSVGDGGCVVYGVQDIPPRLLFMDLRSHEYKGSAGLARDGVTGWIFDKNYHFG